MKRIVTLIVLVLCLFLFMFSNEIEKKVYTTKHINPHPPKIDGKLDDEVWQIGIWEEGFIQSRPYEGKAPSQNTAFKILYDGENIYVAVRAYDNEPDKIEKRLSRRDQLGGDWITIGIDSYYDHRTAFNFGVNAAGVKADEIVSDDGQNFDSNWDPIWYVKTAIDEKGWTAEMRIPLSQLRFGNNENHIWGLEVLRFLFRKEENSMWQLIPQNASGFTSYFGELHGINGIKGKRYIQLKPYTVGSHQRFQKVDGNPFATGRLNNFYGGLDGKIGVTSNMTLDFTLNPDFGQVEADPSEVNLTAFETYFAEKRPFFIEGRNILSFKLMIGNGDLSSDRLFYSRRIGRRPHRTLSSDGDEYVDMPQNTSILGAFKFTGKTKNGLSIGVIEAVTSQEKAAISHLGDRSFETVEPWTNYLGLRLQKDYNKGNTILGTMLTATNRALNDPSLDFLHSGAYTGGLDFYHTWKNKTYFIQANTVFSHVRGSKDAILRTQQSPLRYYQRPDTHHVSLDPNRTSLNGFGGTFVIGRMGNGNLQYIAGLTARSPGLELNDMGYLRNADNILQFIWAGYTIRKPFSIFRRFNINFNQWKGWDFSGTGIFQGGNLGFNFQFKNYWSFGIGVNPQFESLSTSALRGGPYLRYPGGWSSWVNLRSDSRKKLRLSIFGNTFQRRTGNASSNSIGLDLNYTPSSALSLAVNPSFSTSTRDLQYVSTNNYDSEKRYVLARIEQKTLAVTLRLNLSLTPDLSIQFYGQPFISAGEYSDFKYVTNPRAEDYYDRFHLFTDGEIQYDVSQELYSIDENQDGVVDYSIENRNFNFLQFRSNLVLRWEYIPGSSLFLVWSQGRTDFSPTGDFSFSNGMQNLFNAPPHNVFLVKFSYSFNL